MSTAVSPASPAAAPPPILFAPGAGAPSSSAWMRAWAQRLARFGTVAPFDYPYQREGRRRPDPLPALIAAHRQALAALPTEVPALLAGKSMGSRVGCHLAVELAAEAPAPVGAPPRTPSGASSAGAAPGVTPALRPPVALICFGYPLRAAGSGALRDAVLRALSTPVLFLQGTRDPLCPLPDLERVRGEMTAPSTLFVLEGGDHSLQVSRQAARQAAADEQLLGAIAAFVAGLGLPGPAPAPPVREGAR